MELFGVGALEAGLILVITLIVVGPQRFPEIAREGGRWYRTARRYANEVMGDVRGAMSELETEVKAQTEDLRSVREIGDDLTATGRATRADLEAVGTSTSRNLEARRAPEAPVADEDIEFIAPDRPGDLDGGLDTDDRPLEPARPADADR